MSADQVAVTPERQRPERGLSHFIAEQNPLSMAVALVGGASLAVLVLGTLVVLTSHGWTPSQNVAAGITSGAQLGVLWLAVGLGVTGALVGGGSFRRMPTRGARESTIAGAVLGIQGALLAAVFLWFRGGEVEIYARNFLEFNVVGEHLPQFVRAARNTVILAVGGQTIGMSIGVVLSVFALSQRAVIRAPARVYINFLRGTPLLWQLSFFYFGIVLGLRLGLGRFQIAMLVLGLNAGAYTAEIFRAGVQSIERAQLEGARSLGMTYLQSMRFVILPQAVRRVIPPLTNEFVILIKDTSLVSVLGLAFVEQELLSAGREVYATIFNATPFLAVAAGYLVVTLPMIRAVTWLERKLRSGLTGIGA